MKPARVEYFVGKNRHGQPVSLVMTRRADGTEDWEIVRGLADQRDGPEQRIGGLSREDLKAIGQAGETTWSPHKA